jgi:TRAP-type C4-dicarboxylate transport system permease small subunit
MMILASVFIVCQLVLMRYVFNESTVWQTEVVTYLMIGATMLGMPYVQLLRGHINVDLLPLYLKKAPRKVLFVFCVVVQALACSVVAFYSAELFLQAWNGGWRSSSVFGSPLWIPYLAVPLGFGLTVLQYTADLMMTTRVEDPFLPATHQALNPAAEGDR